MGIKAKSGPLPPPPPPPVPIDKDFFYVEALAPNDVVELSGIGSTSAPPSVSLEYSTDRAVWNRFNSPVTLSNIGDKIYLRGNNSSFASNTTVYNMLMTSQHSKVGGNIMSLLDKEVEQTVISNQHCFSNFFKNNKNLIDASDLRLSATSLSYYCYYNMFQSCSSLTDASFELPATVAVNYCCTNMFSGCTALKNAPHISATNAQKNCFSYMFYNCSSLTDAPKLHATTLTNGCYSNMFARCTALSSVEVDFTSWGTNNTAYTYSWLTNVASSGVFKCSSNLPDIRGASNIPTNWSIKDNFNYFYVEALENNDEIALVKQGGPNEISLEYSTDKDTWSSYTVGDTLTLSNIGDKIYFRGQNSTFCQNYQNYYNFTMTGETEIGGRLLSLTSKNTLNNYVNAGAFYNLFKNCVKLKTAQNLIISEASQIDRYGCANLFEGCSGLTTPPTTINTSFGEGACQAMFYNCASLSSIPELPRISLAERCYFNMFGNCTSLSSVPELPATSPSPNCYTYMFDGCTSLTGIIIKLGYLTTGCCTRMLSNCSSLSSVTVSFTDWNEGNDTAGWLANVAENGTFTCNSLLDTTTRNNSHIPENWTVVTN